MSKPRTDLHVIFENILGDAGKIFYQPPENVKLTYPCIIYQLKRFADKRADNDIYKTDKCYSVTLIDKRPDSEFIEPIRRLPYCSFDNEAVVDNLYHYYFTIYF